MGEGRGKETGSETMLVRLSFRDAGAAAANRETRLSAQTVELRI